MDAEGEAEEDHHHHAHHADGRVLAVEVGARAFLHRGGDFLHPGGAGIGRQHLAAGDQPVEQRQDAADDDDDEREGHPRSFPLLWMREPRLGAAEAGRTGMNEP